MIDFGALPPEINSGRMYTGAGPGSMIAASAAWDELAAELQSAGASYASTIATLTAGPWTGPSSMAMAAAAAPYVAWIHTTGAQAEQAAAQAKLAVGAYETAFAATVPPPIIAANRAMLAALVATNILGQNTAAIAATEAHYAEMWAQDAAAMYSYAAASAGATQLTTFTEPPKTTSDSGTSAQSAAASSAASSGSSNIASSLSQFIDSLPTVLQNFATTTLSSTSPTSTTGNLLSGLDSLLPNIINLPAPATTALGQAATNWNTIWTGLAGVYSPLFSWSSIPGGPFLSFGQVYAYAQNGQSLSVFNAIKPITGALAPLMEAAPHLSSATMGGAPISAALGKSALVGSMSVPQGWTEAAPAIKTLASELSTSLSSIPEASMAGEGGVFGQMALSSLAGRAMASAGTYSGSGGVLGSLGGVVAEADPAAATIIVIPALED